MKKIEYFDTLQSLVAACRNRKPKGGDTTIGVTYYDTERFGPATYDEAEQLALNGDEKSWKLLSDECANVDKSAMTSESWRRKVEFAMCGGAVSVPRMLSGAPNCMMGMARKSKQIPVINVLYSFGSWKAHIEKKYKYRGRTKTKLVSVDLTAKFLAKQAAKVLRAVQILERSGVRVNLYVAKANCIDDGDEQGFVVKIKGANVGVSSYSCAFGMMNKAMHTRFHWQWMHTSSNIDSIGCLTFEDVYQETMKHTCNGGKYAFFNVTDCFNKSVQDILDEMVKQLK